MKQPIRYFAIGLFTASVVLLIIVSFLEKPDNDATELPIEEMTEILHKEGYHVLSSAEYITLSMNNESEVTENKEDDEEKDSDKDKKKDQKKNDEDKVNKDEKDENNKDDNQDKADKEKSEAKKYTLTIEPNTLGPTISELLEKNDIIDDAEKFNRYLETEGYAEYIQLGEFELSSNMSNFEIAEKIARKR